MHIFVFMVFAALAFLGTMLIARFPILGVIAAVGVLSVAGIVVWVVGAILAAFMVPL